MEREHYTVKATSVWYLGCLPPYKYCRVKQNRQISQFKKEDYQKTMEKQKRHWKAKWIKLNLFVSLLRKPAIFPAPENLGY